MEQCLTLEQNLNFVTHSITRRTIDLRERIHALELRLGLKDESSEGAPWKDEMALHSHGCPIVRARALHLINTAPFSDCTGEDLAVRARDRRLSQVRCRFRRHRLHHVTYMD